MLLGMKTKLLNLLQGYKILEITITVTAIYFERLTFLFTHIIMLNSNIEEDNTYCCTEMKLILLFLVETSSE